MNQNRRPSFSANSIQDYLDCERRYELKYIQNQPWPAVSSEPILEIERNITRGNRFHFLIHQFFSGVPQHILDKSIQDELILTWFNAFLVFIKKLKIDKSFTEFTLRAQLREYELSAIYDLIILDKDGNILIIDWKTTQNQPQKSFLRKKVQSILYPYVLFESAEEFISTKSISTVNISMQYWYPEFPEGEYVFQYNQEIHNANRVFLEETIREIQTKDVGKFKLTKDKKKCKFCLYRSLCKRGRMAGIIENSNQLDEDDISLSFDFDQIPEITSDI